MLNMYEALEKIAKLIKHKSIKDMTDVEKDLFDILVEADFIKSNNKNNQEEDLDEDDFDIDEELGLK